MYARPVGEKAQASPAELTVTKRKTTIKCKGMEDMIKVEIKKAWLQKAQMLQFGKWPTGCSWQVKRFPVLQNSVEGLYGSEYGCLT